jgi:tRNA-dihydrouridine synthase
MYENLGKAGVSVGKGSGAIDRRVSVAPMMDWTDEPYFIRCVSDLEARRKACDLYVTSKFAGIRGDFA